MSVVGKVVSGEAGHWRPRPPPSRNFNCSDYDSDTSALLESVSEFGTQETFKVALEVPTGSKQNEKATLNSIHLHSE